MDTDDAFWAAIGANPSDSLPRLVYADFLDERAGVVACGRCKGCVRVPCPSCIHWKGRVPKVCSCAGDRWVLCPTCNGTGFIPDGRADLARALRATADRVPWVKVFKIGFGWWCKRSFHDDQDHLIERPIMNAMSDSQERCDRDDTVRFDKRDGVSGGVILFPTSSAAIMALCRAYIAVHCKSEVAT